MLFTTWPQNKDPIFVIDFRNKEIGIVSEIIQEYNGKINKSIKNKNIFLTTNLNI